MDDASLLAVASKIDKTPGDPRRFCILEDVMMDELRVAVDVGSRFHQVAVGDEHGALLDQLRIDHRRAGFESFFGSMGSESLILFTATSSISPRLQQEHGRDQ